MKPVIIVFVDALKPESVDRMDFLRNFTRRKVKAEMGFSSTCQASIYTGVHPDKHQHWFTWEYSPGTSPFNILRKLKITRLPSNMYLKYFWYCSACLLKEREAPYGFLQFARLPMDSWCNFGLQMVHSSREPGPLLGGYPTMFKILRDNYVPYEIVGMRRGAARTATMAAHRLSADPRPLTYYYIGEIDNFSHYYRQESPRTIETIKLIDRAVEQKYRALEKTGDDFYFILLSDHGHIDVEGRVNLTLHFSQSGRNLGDYVHCLDACYARFWFRDSKERTRVEEVLARMGNQGFILSNELLEKYRVKLPDNRYGDLIYYLKPPYIFDIVHPKIISMHGYLPDEPGCDGVLVTNQKIKEQPRVSLVDIMPSVLDALGLPIPDYVDGASLWER